MPYIHKRLYIYIYIFLIWFKEENKTENKNIKYLPLISFVLTSFASPSLCPRDNTSILNFFFFFAIHSFAWLYSSPEHNLLQWLSGNWSACSTGDKGDVGLSPGVGGSLGEGNGYPLQYSCLENPFSRGDWQAILQRVG